METLEIEEDEEHDFNYEMHRQAKFSWWHVLITSLIMVPEITFNMHRIVPLQKSPPFEARCKIDELENSTWSFDQLRRFTQPNYYYGNCTYYNLNYKRYLNMSFGNAIKRTRKKRQSNLLNCKDMVFTDNSFKSIEKEVFESLYMRMQLGCGIFLVQLKLFCHMYVERTIDISPMIGSIFGYLFFGNLADILGRKIILNLGLNGIFCTIIMLNFATTVDLFLITRFISGMFYALVKLTSMALTIELTNSPFRTYTFFITFCGSAGIVYCIDPFLPKLFNNWRYLQWICSIGILIFPLVKWYLPESPKWIYSKGQKGKAWTVLRTLKNAEHLNIVLFYFNNDKIDFSTMYLQHIKDLKRIVSKLQYWSTMFLIAVSGSLYTKNFSLQYQEVSKDPDKRYLLYFHGASEFASMFFCMFLISVIGRRVSICMLLIIIAVLYFILAAVKISIVNTITLFNLEIATSMSYLINLLNAAEIVPTSHRCTYLGVVGGLTGLLTFVLWLLDLYIHETVAYIIFGCVSLSALASMWYDFDENLNDLSEECKDTVTRASH